MFPGLVTEERRPVIEEGLPSLNAAMLAADITTPRRIAAFLTTLSFESWLKYNQRQLTQTRTYYGRGFIQLTGRSGDPDANGFVQNYTPAGEYLGIDLVNNPDLALDIRYSARIATWYWTVARPLCNTYADNLQMGKINRAIGYPVVTYSDGSTNDTRRCTAFVKALAYLTGQAQEIVDCNR